MIFTREQQQAIDARDSQILISAAAGSGKTAVLVQRILALCTGKTPAARRTAERGGQGLGSRIKPAEADEGTDIDRLLVATFTEAAAAEMKERIGDALAQRLEENPNDENLMRQSARLPAATISTIHAFCLRLVKDHFHRLDLDPAFRVGDQTELNLLQGQVMETMFEEAYAGRRPFFAELVETFGGGKTRDISLDKLIRRLYDFIQSRPFPEEASRTYIDIFSTSLDTSVWMDIIREEIALSLDAALESVRRACELCLLPDGPEKYLPALYEDESLICRLQAAINFSLDELYEAFSKIDHEKIHTYRGKEKALVDEGLRQRVKDMRDNDIKERIKKIKSKFLFANPDKMRKDVSRLRPVVNALIELVLDYRAGYSAEKRARNLVDFNDLEHYAIQILWQNGSASDVALSLSAKYDEVMIDEYQDTNEVQECILSAVDTLRRFMVGDVKQSIYGFRHAQPKLFTAKYDKPDIKSIVLSKNFRSRKEVLDAVNFFFYRLMSKAAGDVDYNDEAALYPGAEFPNKNWDFTAELHVIEAVSDDEDEESTAQKIRREARLIAQRIHQMVGHMPIGDRICGYGDIVVLTRSVRSIAATLTEELKQQGVHAAAETSGGFFETPEIMTALSLLRVVDNPRQDIDILAVLRFYGFSADELLNIRYCMDDSVPGDYYDRLLAYVEAGGDAGLRCRAGSFLGDINRWRKKAAVLPISRLIGILYEETGLLYHFGKMAGGAVRQANLRLLLEKAIQYEATSFSGLFHFVRYVEWLQAHSEDESAAMLLPEDDSLVRVMTIHKSKGLEFPVVFVSMLGKQLNKTDERTSVILHPELGIGAMYTDLDLRIRSNTVPRLALSVLRQREAVSEELRVLYVAMTRAREKLILTGCVVDLDDKLEKWKKASVPLPVYSLREGKTYLDWLMPCVLDCVPEKHQQSGERLDAEAEGRVHGMNLLTEEPVRLYVHHGIVETDKVPDVVEERHMQLKMPERIEPAEPGLPSKLAISELKRLYALEISADSTLAYEEENIFEAPLFYKAGQITPLRMGTVLHTVVEHIDLGRDRDAGAIRKLIAVLVSRGLLSQEEAEAVSIEELESFAASPLADRMRASRRLYREVPFVIGIPAVELYGEAARDEAVLVHGIIDCYFETAEGDLVLVDFKSSAHPDTLHVRYATQMKIYKRAIEQAEGRHVTESLFYSFPAKDTIGQNLSQNL